MVNQLSPVRVEHAGLFHGDVAAFPAREPEVVAGPNRVDTYENGRQHCTLELRWIVGTFAAVLKLGDVTR